MSEIEDIWSGLVADYPISSTNKTLVAAIQQNPEKGIWHKYGFPISYTAKKEGNVIVVSTEDVAKSGGCAGGVCYINANNPSQCVWDI